MNDIILRHVTKLRVEGGNIAVIILAVVEHLPLVRGSQPAQCIDQHRFTGAGSSHDSHEFAWSNRKRDIIEQRDMIVAIFLEIERIDANIAALIVLRQSCALEHQPVRPNAYLIAHLQQRVRHNLCIHIHMVRAVKIKDAIRSTLAYQASVMRRNLGMAKLHRIVR